MALALAAVLSAGCTTVRTSASRSAQASVTPGGAAIALMVTVQPEHAAALDRYVHAAVVTLETCGEWFGPLPYHALSIVDPAWHATASDTGETVVLDRAPWWNARATMAPELSTVRALSRKIWRDAVGRGLTPSWFVDGAAEYTARRIVSALFQRDNNPPGYAFLEERYFGGFVPRFVRVRLRAEADGDPLPAYRDHPTTAVTHSPSTPADARSLTAKTILALGTLERWLGQPVFDEILSDFVRQSRARATGLDDFQRIASDVSGQDLGWFFAATFRSNDVFDYGIDRLASERQADGAFRTTVVARRYGEAAFTGRSAPRVGPFESGRGVVLRVAFADGAASTALWDGRDREKTFTYVGPVQAVSAELDPEHVMLLDVRRTNNSVTRDAQGATAATRWAARYLNWVANALLRYAALV